MTDDVLDQWLAHVAAGETLPIDVIRSLAAGPDFLQLGMLADAARQRRHGTRTTFVRVTHMAEESPTTKIAPAAGEIRIDGAPNMLADAIDAVEATAASGGQRAISAFSWADVDRWAGESGGVAAVLARLRRAGLSGIATIPVDSGFDIESAVGLLVDAGFGEIRLHVAQPASNDRVDLWQRVAATQQRFGAIRSVNPLPSAARGSRQTTGYDDVKMVAVARLAADTVPSVQLDWTRYGPKLAQVALTVGVDDLDNVSASDAAPEGQRRAPLDEVRRNIASAGFEPVERDGWFRPVVP